MSEGYIYCLSNVSMPGILKVGVTERTPSERARQLFTTGVPTPFTVEFAKWVKNPYQKETAIHLLLEQYTERMTGREFFRVSKEEVKAFFDLIDGDSWIDQSIQESEDSDADKTNAQKASSDLGSYFVQGQRIRHKIGINKEAIGTFDAANKCINYDGKSYASLSSFALQHYRIYNPTRTSTNGWACCEYEVDGKWAPTAALR